MPQSTLTDDGQTMLPREVRDQLGLKPGDRINYEVEDDRVVIRRAPALDELHGMLKGKGARPVDPDQEKQRARRAWAREASAGEGEPR